MHIQDIESLSREMLSAARLEDWSRLKTLGDERNAMILEVFSSSGAAELGPADREAIENILGLNNDIVTICENKRQSYGEQLNQLQSRRDALTLYHDNASLGQ